MRQDVNCRHGVFCFSKQEEGVDITANSLHPGAIVTNLLRHHGFVNGKISHLVNPLYIFMYNRRIFIYQTIGFLVLINVDCGAFICMIYRLLLACLVFQITVVSMIFLSF